MKKISIIFMAWALVITMSQCKKQVETVEADNVVTITLNVRNGIESKAVVDPNLGSVTYVAGDYIQVTSGGKYVGTLMCNESGHFTGTITNAVANEPLHFFYFGNVTPEDPLVSGVTTSCMVDISNQADNQQENGWHMPVISYAPSEEVYSNTTTEYNARLKNKCALAKFDVTTDSNIDIIITGVNHQVAIDFTQTPPTFTYGKYAEGHINIGKGIGAFEKWVILLPQDAMGVGAEGSAYDANSQYLGVRGAIPEIIANSLHSIGIPVTVNHLNGDDAPTGAINGKFTINAQGGQVYFAQGNLQHIGSVLPSYWRFAEHQWDYIGHSSSQGTDYDLIDWNTASGISSISNGGNHSWRMLTQDQLIYILNRRITTSGIRYAKAILNGVCGLLIFPDDWRSSIFALQSYNSINANFNSNVIDVNLAEVLEANGVVFLPVGGTSGGSYWTATQLDNGNVYSYQILNHTQLSNPISPNNSFYVRMVQDIQAK